MKFQIKARSELATAFLEHPELTELFLKTDRKLRELGVLQPVYTK